MAPRRREVAGCQGEVPQFLEKRPSPFEVRGLGFLLARLLPHHSLPVVFLEAFEHSLHEVEPAERGELVAEGEGHELDRSLGRIAGPLRLVARVALALARRLRRDAGLFGGRTGLIGPGPLALGPHRKPCDPDDRRANSKRSSAAAEAIPGFMTFTATVRRGFSWRPS